jgi:hypothetical protein
MAKPTKLTHARTKVAQACHCLQITETVSIAIPRCERCFGTGITNRGRDDTIKRNQERRIPTVEEQHTFTGAHCRRKYAALTPNWRCPGCNRTKYELIRWTMLFPESPHGYMGWAGGLHEHHDHSGFPGHFLPTVVCEQCNDADKAVKRALGLQGDFSFSPAETPSFVLATAHGWHLLNYSAAKREYIGACKLSPPPPPPPGHFWFTGGPS